MKASEFDEKELAHYRDVIDCCTTNGIEPIITLHHFSSPAWLIGKGGWADDTGIEMANKLWYEDFGYYLPYFKDDDFLGVQNYSRKIVTAEGAKEPTMDAPLTQMGYEDYPSSIGHVVAKVAKDFSGELIVTENGIATDNDARRCEFIKEAYASVVECADAGIPVVGYCYWSLLDNFEWQAGFAKTFGLIAVNRETQERRPKESLSVLGNCTHEINKK